MGKIWEIIKKVGICIAAALSAVALVLIGRGTKKTAAPSARNDDDSCVGCVVGDCLTEEKIEEKCNEKRNETLERLGNSDARKLCENYGAVCDAIADGKIRFQKRCREVD